MKRLFGCALLFAAYFVFGQSTPIELPEGESIAVRLKHGIKADTARPGDEVLAQVIVPVLLHGSIAVPKDARIHGRVIAAVPHAKGVESQLQVLFDHVDWDGGSAPLNAYIVGKLNDVRPARDCWSNRYAQGPSAVKPLFEQGQAPNVLNGVPQPTRAPSSAGGGGIVANQTMGEPPDCAVPGGPNLHYISVHRSQSPRGATVLVSKKRTISLPAGIVLELRQIAPQS